MVTHGSLFSGIGGFDLAAKWMGWENVFHVERDPFCRQVLAHHFPESKSFDDVKAFDATPFRGRIRVLSGGFPCQPFSAAGKRAGTSDDRYLWPEMFRIIREARPTYVVAENVRGLISWNEGMVLDTVCADLEGEGYEVFPVVLPAASVNAPHRRDRIWIVAYRNNGLGEQSKQEVQPRGNAANDGGAESPTHAHDHAQPCYAGAADATNTQYDGLYPAGRNASEQSRNKSKDGVFIGDDADATNAERIGREGRGNGGDGLRAQTLVGPLEVHSVNRNASHPSSRGRTQDHEQHPAEKPELSRTRWERFPTVAPVCGGNDGLPQRLDGITFPKWRRESIKAYGNAIVPQVAYQIFQALNE